MVLTKHSKSGTLYPMRMPFLVLFLTICFVGKAWTQNIGAERRSIVGELQVILQDKISALMFHEEVWEGSGVYLSLPYYSDRGGEEFRQGLGLTEQQILDIQETIASRMDLTVLAYNTATMALGEQTVLSEEIKNVAIASLEMSVPQLLNELDEAAAEHLTPEQIQKFWKLRVIAMSVFPFAYPPMFEALGLTEEQRTLLTELKKELEPEYETMSKQFIADRMLVGKKFENAYAEIFQEISREEWRQKPQQEREKKADEIRNRLLREDTEYRKAMERIHTQGRDFQNRLKDWFDILTHEQIGKLNRLINNPPDYAKKIMESMKRENGDPEKIAEADKWEFLNRAWQPGDPLPEGYLQQRQEQPRRFPRGNNTISIQE